MRTIGLVGGMSWHSTVEYYRALNTGVAAARGGHASARVVLQSLDFAQIRDCQLRGDWDTAAQLLGDAAVACQEGGADVVAICTNLMHKVAPQVEERLDVPLVHIADAVALAAQERGASRLGILGTRWVMEESFYADRLARHGCSALVPGPEDRAMIDRVVFDELTQGIVEDRSRTAYVAAAERLAEAGAEALVLACTEIGLLLSPEDCPVPVVDSAAAHTDLLVGLALDQAEPYRLVRRA